MIRRGWRHEDLMAMREAEFGFWLVEQFDYDKAEAEARQAAARKAKP